MKPLMQLAKKCSAFLLFFAMNTIALAGLNCDKASLVNHGQKVIACYIQESEKIDHPWILKSTEHDDQSHLSIQHYELTSQNWPKADMSKDHQLLWKHTLVLYKPDRVNTNEALLYVNGGTRYPHGIVNPIPQQLNFKRIASLTHSIVADLQDIPNQYLMLDDNTSRKEDGIVAYTWKRYIDDPAKNTYWSLHIPMTKAIIVAMNAIQDIAAKQNLTIKGFVVSGASKRGLVTWLAALNDHRIDAIVPIVIDILNTKKNLDHIYTSYGNQWPPALFDYIQQDIDHYIHTTGFLNLMNIEDPVMYLNCSNCTPYKIRLNIPKYIISASGDDFFVPDSLNLYFDQLPGDNKVRVVPNQSHNISTAVVDDALLTFYWSIVNHQALPSINWQVDKKTGKITNVITHGQIPLSVKLWEAENKNARDFRLAAHIQYTSKMLTGTCKNNECHYAISIETPKKGWKSSFIEANFSQDALQKTAPEMQAFVLTTTAYVIKGAA